MGIDTGSASGGSCEWSPAIYQVDSEFNHKNVWRLRLGPQYEPSGSCSNLPDYAKPDNLVIDEQYIYGTTTNSKILAQGSSPLDNLFAWRVKVTDGLLSEDISDIQALKILTTGQACRTTGVKKGMVNDDEMQE